MESKLFSILLPEFDDFSVDIHTAASIGCEERIREIIESCERKDNIVDERNHKGWTPLMYGACCANLKVVLLLLEEGAEPDLKNYEGQTALILAAKCGSGDVVNLLIDNHAGVNERDVRGWTALFYAIAFGHRSVMQLLIERGAHVDFVCDEERITPLMLAAENGHERIVQELLHLGINVHAESKSGDTARSLALKNGHVNIKYVIDVYVQSKRKTLGPSLQSLDLPSILKELQLTKYCHLFEKQDIDADAFWLLTDDDLKEIGINLLGPRKKICMAIAQYKQEQFLKSATKDASNLESILAENKKMQLYTEKLKTMILQEKQSKIMAERTLADVIQNMKIYDEMFKSTLEQIMDSLSKLKENQDYLKNVLCNFFQEVNFNGNRQLKFKIESIFQCLDCMQKLVEFSQQIILSMQ